MGKSLIIKGADFSQNGFGGTTWYVDKLTGVNPMQSANLANGGWSFENTVNAELQGKTINVIKFKAQKAGTLKLFTATSRAAGSSVTLKTSIIITSEDVGNVVEKQFTAFAVGAAEALVIGEADADQGSFYFQSSSGTSDCFYTKVPSGWSLTGEGNLLCFAVGYRE